MALFGKSKKQAEEEVAPPNRRERRNMARFFRHRGKRDTRALERTLRAEAARKRLLGETE